MDRDVFRDRLLGATKRCREFAAGFVLDTLPGSYAFWVVLNCSYDGDLNEHEVVFPDDVSKHGRRVGPINAEDVVSLLWRDGRVPEWIDIMVYEADEHATYFELSCCGRFTDQDRFLYYDWTDFAPFGVKGPAYPPRLIDSVMEGKLVEKFWLAESPRSPED
jgi:hypothetical protein